MSVNKQFVKTRACMSFIKTAALREHIASALWRAYPRRCMILPPQLHHSALSYEGRKIAALLVQNFQRRPPVFCTFSVEPLVVYNCVLYNLKVLHRF